MKRTEVTLWNSGVFDLSKNDLGRGFRYVSMPGPGVYITLAILRTLSSRKVASGALFPSSSYDVYINLSTGEWTLGGADTSMFRWAHAALFNNIASGTATVEASYLVLARRTASIAGYYHVGNRPTTTLPVIFGDRLPRPVEATYAYFCDFESDYRPFASYPFGKLRVCVADVTIY